MRVLTFEQFATQHGASRNFGDAGLHRSSNSKSPNSHRKDVALQAAKDNQLIAKREELRQEYDELVASGQVRPPTRIESLIQRANGMDEHESVQAARRLLAKENIDWQSA